MSNKMLDYEQFNDYDFILYDQYIFQNLLSIYDFHKIKYKTLLVDIFSRSEDAPIVVDLKSMKDDIKMSFYKKVYLIETSNYINFFDNMYLVQNLIKSDLSLDEFSDEISRLMIIDKTYLFRFYDPRIMIHIFLLNYNQYDLGSVNLKNWMIKHHTMFKVWDIHIWNNRYSLTKENCSQFSHPKLKSNISIECFDTMNRKIKKMILNNQIEDVSSIIKNLQELNQNYEVTYV